MRGESNEDEPSSLKAAGECGGDDIVNCLSSSIVAALAGFSGVS